MFAPVARPSLADEWQRFLEPHGWQWFWTLTCAYGAQQHKIDKLFSVAIQRLGRIAVGRRWYRRAAVPIVWARVTERSRTRERHVHVLILSRGADLTWAENEDALLHWRQKMGFARVKRLSSPRSAVRYLAKQTDDDAEIDVSPDLKGSQTS